MTSVATTIETRPQQVGLGALLRAHQPDRLTAILGSCVGVALYHPRLHVGALAHVVLPRATERGGPPGKFADTAIPHAVALLAEAGANPAGLVAKIAGGSAMFAKEGPLRLGHDNIEAVRAALVAARITIAGEHLGGNKGRRVTLDCATGALVIEVAGQAPLTL